MSTNACRATRPIEQYREYLIRLAKSRARRALKSKLDESDIVQETMLKAHVKRDQFHGQTDDEFAAWLRAILANTIAEAARRFGGPQRNIALEESLDPSSPQLADCFGGELSRPNEHAERNELYVRIADAFNQLPMYQRKALELKHLQGFSVAEIATQMDCTPHAVSGLLRRGLDGLRGLLLELD